MHVARGYLHGAILAFGPGWKTDLECRLRGLTFRNI
jgi:hypothetical protein